MIDIPKLDQLARALADRLPPAVGEMRADLEKNFKAVLQAGLARLDLVTREEFEVQQAVLKRTRAKLDRLEKRLKDLESGA